MAVNYDEIESDRPALEDRLMRQYRAPTGSGRASWTRRSTMMSTSRRVGVAGRWGIAAFCSHAPCAVQLEVGAEVACCESRPEMFRCAMVVSRP